MIRSVRPFLRCPGAIPTATLTTDQTGVATPTLHGPWIPESGFPIFDLPDDWAAPFGVTMVVNAEGYEELRVRFVLYDFAIIPPDQDNSELRIQTTDYDRTLNPLDPPLDYTLALSVPPLLPIIVDGYFFRTSDGAYWTQIGCTDFRLFQRYLAGEDVEPVLSERAALGFNQLRVLLTCDWMFRLHPQEHPEYFPRLSAFCDALQRHGLRAELVVFADATVVMPILSEQQAFFHAVCDTVRDRVNVFVELVNEVDQTINVINTDGFAQPQGIISSHGSKGVVDAAVTDVCVVPAWTYGTLHPGRPADWPRLGGHNTMEDVLERLRVPGTDNESCRPDQGRGPIASDWFDAAGNIALLASGGTMHSETGKASTLFAANPAEQACAVAWVAGAKAVPLEYQRGAYIAGHLSNYPLNWHEGDSVRAHGRLIGGRACCSLPQMREGYVPTARDGWRIVRQEGSVVEVEATTNAAVTALDEERRRRPRREWDR